MKHLTDLVPDVSTFLALDASEVAGLVLEQLCSSKNSSMLFPSQFCHADPQGHFGAYPALHYKTIATSLMEEWAWLVSNGMLAPDANHANDKYFITRLGAKVGDRAGIRDYRKALQLPREKLHPLIAERCSAQFLRGEFDTAVFEAYKSLEVRIREAAGFPHSLFGVVMVQKAFDPDEGPIADVEALPAERKSLRGQRNRKPIAIIISQERAWLKQPATNDSRG